MATFLLFHTDRLRNGVDRGSRRASSRGIIPRAKVKTVKMTIVIVIGMIKKSYKMHNIKIEYVYFSICIMLVTLYCI